MPAFMAICRAMRSVFADVGGASLNFQSGWKAVKCKGTWGPRRSITQALSASISTFESFSPGINRVVISNQTFVVTTQVVGWGSRNPQVGDQACWFCGESLEHIPALFFCR
jgi:hypothetical protein